MPEPKSIKVLLVEGHPLFGKGLTALLAGMGGRPGYSVVGEATTIPQAKKLVEKEKPALVIVDLNLGNENGLDLISWLKDFDPDMAVLVLSEYDERYYSERVLRLGARGYIMKTQPPEKVVDAIKTVMSGKVYLSEPERERIFVAMTGESRRGVKDWSISVKKLSDRELQIFTCLGKGLGTIEIANKYNLSTKTIDTHKEHIKLKLHCNTSQELRRLAIEYATNPSEQ